MRDEDEVRAHARLRPARCRRSATRDRGDLRCRGLPREKVLATVVRLLETTLIRVGNEEYAQAEQELRPDHAARPPRRRSTARKLRFQFRGKSGKEHRDSSVNDRRARAHRQAPARTCPASELFQYLDEDGERHAVDSADVNDYLREITGQDFTAKDFRTWAGTVLAALALPEFESFDTKAAAKRNRERRRSSGSPRGSATRPPSAASATSIPRCWTAISKAIWSIS